MTFQADGYNWLLRLEKGELLVEQLTRFIKEQNITGAWVSGLGGAAWAELGFYNLPKKTYSWYKVDQFLEIASLQGNVAWDGGKLALHLHGTFSMAGLQTIGGHVKELEVAGTCEVFIHKWYGEGLHRTQDTATGLNLLDL